MVEEEEQVQPAAEAAEVQPGILLVPAAAVLAEVETYGDVIHT